MVDGMQAILHASKVKPPTHIMKSLVGKLKINIILLTSVVRYIGYCVEQPKIKKKFLIFLFVKLRPFLTGLSRDHNNSVRH